MKTKLLAIFLTICMVVTLVPMTALADGDVASVGSTTYSTLEAAIGAAGSGDTVTLLQDVTPSASISIPAGKTLTIVGKDGGAKITASFDDLFKVNGGSLTLGENLTITNTSTIVWLTSGSVTIAGAKLSNSSSKYPTVLAENSGSSLTITGGEIKATAEKDSYDHDFAVVVEDGATASITGGTISAKGNNALMVGKGSSVSLSGGTVTAEEGNPFAAAAVNDADTGASLTVSGGATLMGESALVAMGAHGNVSVTGGSITGRVGTDNSGVLSVSGGTFSDNSAEAFLAPGYALEPNAGGGFGVEPVYTVTFSVTPTGASILVQDANENEVSAEADGTYELVNGTYTYSVTEDGYTEKTGSFTVNGADQDITVELAEIVYCTVTFKVDGKVLSTETVEYGDDVTLPEIPAKVGYTQVAPAWDKDGKNITSDIVINAVYTANEYTITFMDENGVYKKLTVKHGEQVEMPEVPKKEGYTVAWDTTITTATADATVKAVYTENSAGTPAPTPTPTPKPDDSTYPDTGDNSHLGLWLTLLIISACVVIGLSFFNLRKKSYIGKHLR